MQPDISTYYDSFITSQEKTGVNLRHRQIIKELIRVGLKKSHNVLEIGCGIGTLSGLLSNYLKNGTLQSCDISPKSIDFAQHNNKYSNTTFNCIDITKVSLNGKYDFIVLPDVLEHIPIELHANVFKKLASSLSECGKIAIHIPSAQYQIFCKTNCPEKMQIIDQPIQINDIVKYSSDYELIIENVKYKNIFHMEYDYVFIVLSKNLPVFYNSKSKIKRYIQDKLSQISLFMKL